MKKLLFVMEETKRIWGLFLAVWENSEESWRDPAREIFEQRYMKDISSATNKYIISLAKLNEELERIFRELPKVEK